MLTHEERKVRCANPFSLGAQPNETLGVRRHQMACPTAERKRNMSAIICIKMIMEHSGACLASPSAPVYRYRKEKGNQFLALVSPVVTNLLGTWEYVLCICKSCAIIGTPQKVEGWDCLVDLLPLCLVIQHKVRSVKTDMSLPFKST